jgi:hypothetical protein
VCVCARSPMNVLQSAIKILAVHDMIIN